MVAREYPGCCLFSCIAPASGSAFAKGGRKRLATYSLPPRQGCKGATFRTQPHSLQSSPIAACNHSAVLVQTWYLLLFLSNLDSP
jgi:hypothetical protein